MTGPFAEGARRWQKRRKARDGAGTSDSSIALTIGCAFSGEALSAVVAFAVSNDAPALWNGSAGLLSEIFEASDYYDIFDPRCKAKRQLSLRAEEFSDEVCVVLEAVWDRWYAVEFGDGTADTVANIALAAIDELGDEALMSRRGLCESAMAKVFSSSNTSGSEVDLFKALQIWEAQLTRKIGLMLRSASSLAWI